MKKPHRQGGVVEYQSGREDLNLRPLRPERSTLSKLSYSPGKPEI